MKTAAHVEASTTRAHGTAPGSKVWTLKVGDSMRTSIGAGALENCQRAACEERCLMAKLPQDDPPGHKNSNARFQCLPRLCEGWDNRLGRDRDLDNGSIAWLGINMIS